MSNASYHLFGGNPSPYSRKLRAILRYRRLPHVWTVGTADTVAELAQVKPRLIPILRLPDSAEYRVDSTPLAYLLEQRHPDQRSIIPPDAADAFICHLLEDFADEWLTKLMFHYRWHEDETASWASHWIVYDMLPALDDKAHAQAARMFHDRQRQRRAIVGCTPENAALIEGSYQRLLQILGPYVSASRHLFGSRPSLADFALYGQLAQLVTDPWPQRVCRQQAPAVEGWVTALDDASGLEGQWRADAAEPVRAALLEMVGAEYLPFLQANARALAAGSSRVELDIRGQHYRQAPFAYQGKCYAELCQRWSALDAEDQARLQPILEQTGCLSRLRDR